MTYKPDGKRRSISAEDLLLALNPARVVINRWRKEHESVIRGPLEAQDAFARFIDAVQSIFSQECGVDSFGGPPSSYLYSVVKCFIDQIERNYSEDVIESEHLMELFNSVLVHKKEDSADDSCYLYFRMLEDDLPMLRIRIFPRHNDVALRLWEAGAVLAEYLYAHPHHVASKHVAEVGAGVGVTSLIALGCCNASHVHVTDYTEVCIKNLHHNFAINEKWIEENGKDPSSAFSIANVEWGEYASGSTSTSEGLCESSVLLAADVAYDMDDIDGLVGAFRKFLSGGDVESKTILYAMTLRNEKTFSVLMEKMINMGVKSRVLVSGKACTDLPVLFPVSFTQSREDVRVYELCLGGE